MIHNYCIATDITTTNNMTTADIAATMMADLGLARRDYVSFPLANGRYWDDVNQQEKTQAENASRARARNNSSDDIQRSEILRKWNGKITS